MAEQFALLQTDIVDSTRLNEQLGDAAMSSLWEAHDRLSRDLLRKWRGRELDRTDGFLLVFTDTADAVNYAVAYHRALASLGVPVKARAGLHLGPLTARKNLSADVELGARQIEIEGLAISTAARVNALAQGGQTLLTVQARMALGVTTLRLQGHGHWRIKGLVEPIELFEIGDAASPFTPPPDVAKAYRVARVGADWVPARKVPNNLPAERDPFVGRGDSLLNLTTRFDDGARLVSILGIGGIGKTRLALRYGRGWLGDYSGGVWFCDLSAAREPGGIVYAVAQSLDVPLGKVDPVDQLGKAIAGRGPCLVILDNFEQVARHAEQTLGTWLKLAPDARFVVTSREMLGISGEHALVLTPLSAEEAVLLFQQRVRAAGVSHDADLNDQEPISALVNLLDRLPLAIELAAARVQVMPPRVLLQRMNERFRLLAATGGESTGRRRYVRRSTGRGICCRQRKRRP